MSNHSTPAAGNPSARLPGSAPQSPSRTQSQRSRVPSAEDNDEATEAQRRAEPSFSSLSTTPTQSQVLHMQSPRSASTGASSSFLNHQQQQQQQPLSATALARNPTTAASQRSVSYAPSDISGMSMSEYDSGEDDYDTQDLANSELRPSSRLSKGRGPPMSASVNLGSTSGSAISRDRRSHHPPSAFERHAPGASAGTSAGLNISHQQQLSGQSQAASTTASTARPGSTSRNSNRPRPQSERRGSTSGRDRDRNTSKSRRQSLARDGGRGGESNLNDDDDDNENSRGRYGIFDDEDDEVQHLDRGEELVRRRMKARQREKALKKKKEKEAAAGRTNDSDSVPMTGAPTTTSVAPSSTTIGPEEDSDLHRDEERDTLTGLVTEQQPQAQAQAQGQQQAPQPQPAQQQQQQAQQPQQQQQQQQQRVSIFSDDGYLSQSGHGPEEELRSPRLGGINLALGAGGVGGGGGGGTVDGGDDTQPLAEDGDEDEDEDEETPSPEESDDAGDVEYTLKDRQDAINIEHPFGLPIWKPALYKKSRSVTRNAETALHSIPSAAAERHFLPGNILWTLFFGIWLSLVCFLVALILHFVPSGGEKYSRVVRELGQYLLWPFGKYVEVEIHPYAGDRTSTRRPFSGVGDGDDDRLPDADAFEEEYFAHYARLQNAKLGQQNNDSRDDEDAYQTTPFTPVAARWPHDHSHRIAFNSRGGSQAERSDSQDTFRGAAPGAHAALESYQDAHDADRSHETLRRSDAMRLAAADAGHAGHAEEHAESSSSGGSGRDGHSSAAAAAMPAGMSPYGSRRMPSETTSLRFQDGAGINSGNKGKQNYGATADGGNGADDEDDPFLSRQGAAGAPRPDEISGLYGYELDEDGHDVGRSQRMVGTIVYGLAFWLILAPLMGIVCLLCWGMVFPVPMGKLSWVLLKNLAKRPLALHFRSAPKMPSGSGGAGAHEPLDGDDATAAAATATAGGSRANGKKPSKIWRPLRPGQLAPRSKSFQGKGNSVRHRKGKILLCTYRAVGLQYYKYTVGGVNIIFINLLPVIAFTILDFFVLEKYVEHHNITSGPLVALTSQTFIFMLALGSVIPLSYFIGMAVASISAQSSIGMGAVINATFGSIIEIILYSLALTQHKARLVEGSIVGSILAGVLLMPGLSMLSGATRRKEQRFNARSAGVTSTMLIMAIIGILTPTLFYQIYGTFQLTCEECPHDAVPGESWTCKRCYYQHVPASTDPFFQTNLKGLMYTCTVILVLSYGIGLWYSLRTHASQIWQNPQPISHTHVQPALHGLGVSGPNGQHVPLATAAHMVSIPSAQRASIYKRLLPVLPATRSNTQQTQGNEHNQGSVASRSRDLEGRPSVVATGEGSLPPLHLPENISQEEYARAVAITASAFHTALQEHSRGVGSGQHGSHVNQAIPRSVAADRHMSKHEPEGEDEAHGGHDAPSWSRQTSVSVLLGCTVLYAIIAEILVDVVDVVLKGSGIDEKFLGITLFALVPNTTEFMNAMSFAINGNIALSMEIGSAYALQVCLIQIPAMVFFSAYYNAGGASSVVDSIFTLIFPRWDVIAIIFSIFLLTYTYIEARSNYYRGSICILSYLVLVAGFFFAPTSGDNEIPPDEGIPNMLAMSFQTLHGAFGGEPVAAISSVGAKTVGGLWAAAAVPTLSGARWVQALVGSLWAR